MSLKPLTSDDLDKIFQKYVDKHVRVSCDEYHAHGFNCAAFDSEQVMILERLRVEVELLQDKLKKISKLANG